MCPLKTSSQKSQLLKTPPQKSDARKKQQGDANAPNTQPPKLSMCEQQDDTKVSNKCTSKSGMCKLQDGAKAPNKHTSKSITVLTIPERADLYRSIVGQDADFKFDPKITTPLDDFLVMVSINRGSLVVLDEAHFFDENNLKEGIKKYVNNPLNSKRSLRIIFVCSERCPGDDLLSFLSSYCCFYDIIYDCQSVDIPIKLGQLIAKPNSRFNILDLLEPALTATKVIASNITKDAVSASAKDATSTSTEDPANAAENATSAHAVSSANAVEKAESTLTLNKEPILLKQSAKKDENGITINIQIQIQK